MKNYILFLSILLISSNISFSQKGPSIHQIDKERYSAIKLQKSVEPGNPAEIVSLNKSIEKNLTHNIDQATNIK